MDGHNLHAVEVTGNLHREFVFLLLPKLQKIADARTVTTLPFVNGIHEILKEDVGNDVEIVIITDLHAQIVNAT